MKWLKQALRSGRRLWIILGSAAIGAATTAMIWHVVQEATETKKMPVRFAVVAEGKLYRSGQPDRDELRNICRDYRIRTILLLRDEEYPEEQGEYWVAGRKGVKIVRLGISSKELPEDMLGELRRVFRDEANYPILVHCEHGIARTGVAVALWRLEMDGWTGPRAVDEMVEKGYPVRAQGEEMMDRLRAWGVPKSGVSQD